MDGGIPGDASLDYATIQILPALNRYEVYISGDDKVEKLAAGVVEQLLPHLPGVAKLYDKGSNANFKLQSPEGLESGAWFTKSTLSRFLHLVGSMDLISSTNAIEGEISQLEEARKFHLSLYSQGCQDGECKEKGDCSSIDATQTAQQPEGQISSSDTSKNELLRAMDLRLMALGKELTSSFKQATGATYSCEEITHLAKFSESFGARDLKKILCKVLELSQRSQVTDSPADEISSLTHASAENRESDTNANTYLSMRANKSTPVKYGVSPAKVAQVERQSLTESEESSGSSDEKETSTDRSRTLIRSASPRRSASPMRRVQIGRSGSRRAPALTIKSLNFYPARDRGIFHRDITAESSEDESSEVSKKPENNVRRMSVQDAINLFESKQKDHSTDTLKRNSLTSLSLGANKSVLRRWSSGVGESSAEGQPPTACEDSVPVPENGIDGNILSSSAPDNLDSDAKLGSQDMIETAEVDANLERQEEQTCSPAHTETAVNVPAHCEETNERLKTSAEWIRQKEMDLNQMLTKVMENQPARYKKPQSNTGRNLPPEQRGGFYDHYKEKRDKKLQGENAKRRAEKEAQFKAMQKILDERKAEMASANANNPVTKHAKKPHNLLKNPPKSLKVPSPLVNPKKETSKPSITRKVSSKASTLPATRKSWPSSPPPRMTGASSAKTSGGISSANTTPTRRKPISAQLPSGQAGKGEKSQQQVRKSKQAQPDSGRSLKSMSEKQQKMIKGTKTAKTKVTTTPGDCPSVAPAKPSLYNKVTKKSSVVPLETKPSISKGPGIRSGARKMKNASLLEKSSQNSESLVESKLNSGTVSAPPSVIETKEQVIMSLDHSSTAIELDHQVTGQGKSTEMESSDEIAAAIDCASKIMAPSSPKYEEITISPAAWVEIEDRQDLQNQCDDSANELASSTNAAPMGFSSPRVRHSLSQMLQEESSEADPMEWGNAENPPAMVYHKDAPKGLKRLLKFARKSKADANLTGWSTPSAASEGEDDAEESKAISKRNSDNLLRKAALHAKNFGPQKTYVSEGYEQNLDAPDFTSVQTGISRFDTHDSHKMHKGSVSAMAPAKATRSFFSLSAFRGTR